MRSTFTNRPTSGRLSASSIRLPTYIEAMKPQNTSGCSVTSCGPGGTPWISSAAISTAVTGPVGRPSASIGTKAPVEAALLADSGPGDAGDRALAELLRMLGDALLQRIGQEARDDVRRARHDADQEAQHRAARDRHRRLAPFLAGRQQLAQPRRRSTLPVTLWLGVDRISPSPNSPTATGTMPMPSPSSGMSNA